MVQNLTVSESLIWKSSPGHTWRSNDKMVINWACQGHNLYINALLCPQLRRSWRGKLVWACSTVHPSTPPPPTNPQPAPPPPPKYFFFLDLDSLWKKITYSSSPPALRPPPPQFFFYFKFGFIVKTIHLLQPPPTNPHPHTYTRPPSPATSTHTPSTQFFFNLDPL